MSKLGQMRVRAASGHSKRSRGASLVLVAGSAFVFGCGDSPTRVSGFVGPVDSVRYVAAPGTPHAVATVWDHGVVNVAVPFQTTVQSGIPITYCTARATIVWRGARVGNLITGHVCTTNDPDYATDPGDLVLLIEGDTLRGQAQTILATECGNALVDMPLTLVRSSPEVP